jgi:signal transduction histidine kinase
VSLDDTGALRQARAIAVLDARAGAAPEFLRAPYSESALAAMFERLGRAADASRIYLFVNRLAADGDRVADQRVEWCAEGIAPQIGSPDLQGWSYAGTGNGWLHERLTAGAAVGGPVGELPFALQRVLERQQILSVLLVPVAAHGALWGFLGFDDCREARRWSEVETGALRLAASIVAAAVERRDAEASLRESEEKLRHTLRLEASVRLAAGLSRDFEGLLAGLRHTGERLLARLGAADPLRAEVSEMLLAAERAADLSRELVVFSSQQPSRPVRVELAAWFAERAVLLRRIAGEGVELAIETPALAGRVEIDPDLLEQAMVALVQHGRDRMPGGGRIAIATAEVDGREVAARGAAGAVAASYQRITLRDDAPRLAAGVAERLFEPFSGALAGDRGPRLGLSIVYGIARQCGGFVAAASPEPGGVVVDLYLPVAPGAAAADGAREAPPAQILLVEDEDLIRDLAEQILAGSGYRVLAAANANEALALASRAGDAIDLLLTDVVMPGASGSDLAQRLLRLHPAMKVLYMSGYSDSLVFRYGREQEPAAFLQKPFSAEVLERRVQALLAGG